MVSLFRKALERSRDTFGRAVRLFDRPFIGEEVWTELEEVLIGADVGMETAEKLIASVRQRVAKESVGGDGVRAILKQEMVKILTLPLATPPNGHSPRVTLIVGVNGSGKTTSIAKLAFGLKAQGRSVLIAAGDTFRAAAINQIKLWGDRLGVDVVAHQPGADPGAVVYDALQAARSRQANDLIIDTAGRLHTKYNLMEELKKVRRVASRIDSTAPHHVILVIDATTGQNGLAQARHFTEAVGVTGIFLAKLDGTAKGGIVVAIKRQVDVPVKFVGMGETPDDLAEFDSTRFVEALFS